MRSLTNCTADYYNQSHDRLTPHLVVFGQLAFGLAGLGLQGILQKKMLNLECNSQSCPYLGGLVTLL